MERKNKSFLHVELLFNICLLNAAGSNQAGNIFVLFYIVPYCLADGKCSINKWNWHIRRSVYLMGLLRGQIDDEYRNS